MSSDVLINGAETTAEKEIGIIKLKDKKVKFKSNKSNKELSIPFEDIKNIDKEEFEEKKRSLLIIECSGKKYIFRFEGGKIKII